MLYSVTLARKTYFLLAEGTIKKLELMHAYIEYTSKFYI